MAAHAEYAPSSSKRWLTCPGSITLAPKQIDDTPSKYAWEGTVCHDIAAICLKQKLHASDWLGKFVDSVDDGERTGDDVEITQELVDAIQMYVDEVTATASDMGVKGGKVEFTVKITADCWGTVDAALWNDDTLCIIDAKFGKGVIVEAENNSQMRLYGVGTLKELKAEGMKMPTHVTMKIVQPRTVNPVREETLTAQGLQNWAKDVVAPALQKLRKLDDTCVPSEGGCMWCPVKGCKAQTLKMLDKAEKAFAPFTDMDSPWDKIATSSNLILPMEAQAKVALSFKAIEDWMKSIREELYTWAQAGEDVPYFKMVAGRSVRKWSADEKELVDFLVKHDFDPYEERLKTPPVVEKEMGKKKAKEIDLARFINKPEGKPTLVPETDKRPALEANVEKSFEDFAVPEETATSGNQTIVVEDKKDSPVLSLAQRLAQGADDDEPVTATKILEHRKGTPAEEPEETRIDEVTPEDDLDALDVEEEREVRGSPAPPTAPKRLQVLNIILKGPVLSLAQIADECGITENSVRMHIRYLNERDGYGYRIYSDGNVILTN